MGGRPSQGPRRRRARPIELAALALVALATLPACAPQPGPSDRHAMGFPSPLTGPGVPPLDGSAERALQDGWSDLLSGRTADAASAARAATGPAAELLALQAEAVVDARGALDALGELARSNPDYAAAWLTWSVAAERAGDEAAAWEAARRGAELWPSGPWSDRVEQLRTRWITDRIARAEGELDTDPQAALGIAREALTLDPDLDRARLVEARALLALDRRDEADAAAAALEPDPRARMLRGEIAERRGDWLGAMAHYQEVPSEVAGRDRALLRAQLRWRLQVLPQWVRQAADSERLSRQQLAVLLVSLLPQLETLPSGPTPLMSDIVDLPGRSDIVTAVRLGLFEVDRLEHRFDPYRTVTADEARAAIDAAVDRLGWGPVRWCDGTVVSSACYDIGTPVTGHAVTAVLLGLAEGEGS